MSEVFSEPFEHQAAMQVPTDDAGALLGALTKWFDQVLLDYRDGEREIELACYGGRVRIAVAAPGELAVRAAAPEPGALANLRHMVSNGILQTAPDVALAWTGDGANDRALPQFRAMRVVDAFDVTPRMRRIRLAGEDLARYGAEAGLHVRLIFPPEGRVPVWPHGDTSGIPVWPQGEDAVTTRTYTIRRVDPDNGVLDIDAVLHAGDHPGAAWARTARTGSIIGMIGPGGGALPVTDRILMAGDETALPAIARCLELMPSHATGEVYIEVQDDAERQPLNHPEGIAVRWLSREGRDAGTADRLFDAIRASDWQPGEDGFVWVATEFQAYKRLRAYCRKDLGLPKRRLYVVPFWQRGHVPPPG